LELSYGGQLQRRHPATRYRRKRLIQGAAALVRIDVQGCLRTVEQRVFMSGPISRCSSEWSGQMRACFRRPLRDLAPSRTLVANAEGERHLMVRYLP
jgi:hypothetical protein